MVVANPSRSIVSHETTAHCIKPSVVSSLKASSKTFAPSSTCPLASIHRHKTMHEAQRALSSQCTVSNHCTKVSEACPLLPCDIPKHCAKLSTVLILTEHNAVFNAASQSNALSERALELVGRGRFFCLPGHRLILRRASKTRGALPTCRVHCCLLCVYFSRLLRV